MPGKYELGSELPDWVRKAPRTSTDPAAAARALRPVLEESAAEGERQGYLTDAVNRALITSGLFGLLLPRELGGIEADPETYIDCLEQITYADGSAGWVFMATTFAISGMASMLGPEAIAAMYDSEAGYIAAGQIAPTGKAERVAGGYQVSGRFQFGSGCRISSWMLGNFIVQENGKPALTPEGHPQQIWCVAPRSRIGFDYQSWDVVALGATASYDFEFIPQFVPDDYVMLATSTRRRGGPVFDIGVSMGHVTWALGAAMRVIDEVKAIAKRKRRVGRATLIDQATFQRDFAETAMSLESARALVRKVYRDWFAAAGLAADGKAPLEVRAEARATACWATKICAEVARFGFQAGGSDSVRNAEDNRLQRFCRELQVAATHRHVDDNVLLDSATVMLGINDPKLVL
jgi:alkylation response protein AidB-like acyl-CoA dehydrogenase